MASEFCITRRRFVQIVAGTASFGLADFGLGGLVVSAQSRGAAPRPLPGGTNTLWGIFIHHYPPKPGGDLAAMDDPSQITDLDGWVCDSRIFGMGTATDTKAGGTTRYPFMADIGIMKGTYVGQDGRRRTGLFGFI